MFSNRLSSIAVLLLLGSSLPALAQGHMCSNRLIAGTYSFSCTGTVMLPDANAPAPIAMLGVVKSDAMGNWEGNHTLTINGLQFMHQYVTTDPNWGGVPAEVKPDCSGTITYEILTGDPVASDAEKFAPLPINFVIMNNGNEIRGLPTSPGYAVICQLIRQRTTD